MRSSKRISIASSCAVGAATFFSTGSANATQGTLATVSLNGSSGQDDYVFTNNTTSATFDTISGGAPVNFIYESTNINGTLNPGVTGNLDAHLFLSSNTATQAGNVFPGFNVQPIDSGTVQILLDTPVDGKNNLLTATFSNADILGGDSTLSLSGQDGLNSSTVTYSSDFLNFGGTTTGDSFQFTTANAAPSVTVDPDGFLTRFAATGLTTFTFDNANAQVSAVPEPTTTALLALGATTLLGRRRRRSIGR